MTSVPLDIDAGQVVRWLLEAHGAQEERLSVRATRQYRAQGLSPSLSPGLDDEDAEDLAVHRAVGLLEVRPPPDRDGWALSVRVEDVVSPGLPDDEPVPEGEEEIDLATFQAEFVKPDGAAAEVSAEVTDMAARRRLDHLIAEMREDRHAPR